MDQLNANLVKHFEYALKDNWYLKALSDYEGASFKYKEVAFRVCRLHQVFAACGVAKGDKVALIGKNSAHWGITFLATVTYGAVVVPLLPDFPADSVHHLVNHSDAVLLFSSEVIYSKLDVKAMPLLRAAFKLEDFLFLNVSDPVLEVKVNAASLAFEKYHRQGFQKDAVEFDAVGGEEPAVISYTSGTTGASKGVMIPHRSLLANMLFAQHHMPLKSGDKIVSFLPSAHMYGCAFEFLFPFTIGGNITFLTRTPSPAVVLKAFAEIRPALILSVPLVIEKVYKKKIQPQLKTPMIRFLRTLPIMRQLVHRKIRKAVYASFGGNFTELVIGGAAFNPQAEKFFRTIQLPFTIGYGMTECGPLIAYAPWNETELGASGRAVDALEVKIDSARPKRVAGEIIVRGDHVMLGYYKNPEETRKVLDEDGWFHTGDLGTIDEKGNIYIRGRKKTMLLSASGENVYPDEIEALINSLWVVQESLVVLRGSRLVAIVVPDQEALKTRGKTNQDLSVLLKGFLHELNRKLPKSMHVSTIEIRLDEFEKTPKQSIKRFLYK